jgi:hypothetical protein
MLRVWQGIKEMVCRIEMGRGCTLCGACFQGVARSEMTKKCVGVNKDIGKEHSVVAHVFAILKETRAGGQRRKNGAHVLN